MKEFDVVQYPKSFVPPSFKVFDSSVNTRQHFTHFRASCCNAGSSDALLFRIFVCSIVGTTFDLHVDLPNGSVRIFVELENIFIKCFVGVHQKVTVSDLVEK